MEFASGGIKTLEEKPIPGLIRFNSKQRQRSRQMASVRARNPYIFARSILQQWLARSTLICQRPTTTGGVGFPQVRSMLPADNTVTVQCDEIDLWSFFGICWGAWSLTTFIVMARARTTRQLYARSRDPPYITQ
jgi:hypothetical protein